MISAILHHVRYNLDKIKSTRFFDGDLHQHLSPTALVKPDIDALDDIRPLVVRIGF